MIDLMTLEAVDERRRAALQAPERMKPPIRDVAAYEIMVRAGERLQKEAVEIGTRRQLTPIEAYAPHWVTGGDVVYLNCRDGYDMSPGTAMSAGTVALLSHFEPGAVLSAIDRYRPTTLQLLPPALADILNHPKAASCDFSSLRCCIVGGDKVPPAVQERFRDRAGLAVTETCGMTESFSYAMNPPYGEKRLGSIGRPVHDTRLRLVDDAGREVAPGEVGEILVASRANMGGYWADPAETAKVLQDGWIRTGDLARMDADGYYWFAGRKKDIIIHGGSNISPLEVEDVIYQHPAVRTAGVVGVPDEHAGEIVRAYVALRDDAPALAQDELQAFVAARIAAYKVPAEVEFVSELPLNAVGKVDRRRLKEWAQKK